MTTAIEKTIVIEEVLIKKTMLKCLWFWDPQGYVECNDQWFEKCQQRHVEKWIWKNQMTLEILPTAMNLRKRLFLNSCVQWSNWWSFAFILFNHVFIAIILFLWYTIFIFFIFFCLIVQYVFQTHGKWQSWYVRNCKWFLQIWWRHNPKHDGYNGGILVACVNNWCVFWLMMSKKLC